MPELPEVETMRRGIAAIVGCTITRISCPKTKLRPIEIKPCLSQLRRRVEGRKIAEVSRMGKRIVLQLDSADCIVIEPRMTGRVLLAEPPNSSHLRLVLDLTGGDAPRLLFWDTRGLGVVRLLTPEEYADQLGPARLGPDALEITCDDFRRRLGPSRRPIKVALMDQRVLTGVGNLYASEILHRAGVHPALACNLLRPLQWRRIHAQMAEVLLEAIRHEGSTLSDGNYRTANNTAGGFQDQHRVYQRAGQPCLQCGKGQIVRIVQAQRSTFFCPICQRRKRATSSVVRRSAS